LLSNDFSKFGQRELCGAMGKETKRSPDRLDRDIRAADALELARLMPPGPERNGALKLCARVQTVAAGVPTLYLKLPQSPENARAGRRRAKADRHGGGKCRRAAA
jgi:hypothetical protein